MKIAAVTVAGLILIVLIGGFAVLYGGWYNIAASEPHTRVERWILETAKRASVRRHAAPVSVPPLDRPEQMLAGAGGYADMCAPCHGAPGVDRSAMGRGLNPLPPAPQDMVPVWTAAEMFWITKHGIRMTGMPAWGADHTDEQIWEVVAFLQHLPDMTPEEYAEWVEKAPEHEHAHGHDHADHDPEDEPEHHHQHE